MTGPFALNVADVRLQREPWWTRARRRTRSFALDVGGLRPAWPRGASLRCLYLHSVYDDQRAGFTSLLERLLRLGRVISTDTLVRVFSRQEAPRGRWFHLSFDDGFDNIYRNAFPIMQSFGVSAAIFVPTEFIGASDAVVCERWWDRHFVRRPTRPMQWGWLSEMQRHGFEVGCHTKTHARLSSISHQPQRLRDEVLGAKEELEQRLGVRCRYIAWPYGTLRDIDEVSLDCVRDGGFDLSFSAIRDSVDAERTSRFMVPRHWVDASWPWKHVRFFALGGAEKWRSAHPRLASTLRG